MPERVVQWCCYRTGPSSPRSSPIFILLDPLAHLRIDRTLGLFSGTHALVLGIITTYLRTSPPAPPPLHIVYLTSCIPRSSLWFYGRATSSHHLRTSLSLSTCAVYAFPALVGTFDYRLQFRHFTKRQSASPAYCIYCKLWTPSNYGRLFFSGILLTSHDLSYDVVSPFWGGSWVRSTTFLPLIHVGDKEIV